MSRAIGILQGRFGRVALLDMDQALVPHAHQQCHVLLKVGGADSCFNVRGRLQPLTDHRAVLINAWEPHFYAHRKGAPATVILALYIEPAWLAAIQTSLQASAHPRFFPRPSIPVPPRFRALAEQLVSGLTEPVIPGQGWAESFIFELMLAVIEPFSEWRRADWLHGGPMRPPRDPRIARAMAYLRAHLGQPVDMHELARRVGLSRAHFYARFRRCTSVTPRVFLNTLRMDAAAHRLGGDPASRLAALSDDLGFAAQSHFTRFFRYHLGITPSEYRRIVNVFAPLPAAPE